MLDDDSHVKNQNVENSNNLRLLFNDLHIKFHSLERDVSGEFPSG